MTTSQQTRMSFKGGKACGVAICSHARNELLMNKKGTLHWVNNTTMPWPVLLYCRESEVDQYGPVAEHYNVRLQTVPDTCTDWGITHDAIIRHALCEHDIEYLAICDDDLLFSKRDWDSERLVPIEPWETKAAFMDLFDALVDPTVAHVGFRQRAFGQNCVNKVDTFKRLMWVHGVHTGRTIANDLMFGWKGIVMGDFYYSLTAIQKGFTTLQLNSWIIDDGVGPYGEGGCNRYRTLAMRTQAAHWLQEMFPSAVTLRQKETPGGEWYTDVTVRFANARVK